MELRRPAALSRAGTPTSLGPGLVLALGLFAYRPLFLETLGLPRSAEVVGWFFTPEEKTPLLAIGIAGWLLWRRRARLRALPDESAPATGAALLLLGTGLFVWAQLTRTADLLLPSLASILLAFACLARGIAGCRAVSFPALVLLLGIPIPGPLRHELVWQLQLWSASGASWMLETLGYDVTLSGVRLERGPFRFTVIDSCSGLRGIEILTLVSLAIRELFAASGKRPWLLVLLAPLLGFALNLARIVLVVVATAGGDPAADPERWDHTVEGMAVLIAGTAFLYALGRGLAGPAAPGESDASLGRVPGRPRSERGWRAAAAVLAALGAVSVFVTPFSTGFASSGWVEIPRSRAGWEGEDLSIDRALFGRVGQALYRRYERPRRDRPPQSVELFLGYEVPESPVGDRLFSRRTSHPGPGWSLEQTRQRRLWTLGVDADLAVASRDSELALVYSWRVRDGGIWGETPRSVLGLERGPFRRERRRVVVRLVTPLRSEGPVAFDRAKRTLDRFIIDFGDELARL